jgi:hypothetical protein
MEEKHTWHYTTLKAFKEIWKSKLLKSRALLISEKLRAERDDWEILRRSPQALEAALPKYMLHERSFLRHRPILWFSRAQTWELQAGSFNETKFGGEWCEATKCGELPMAATYEQGGGLVRLGMPESKLLGWAALMFVAGFSWQEQATMHVMDFFNQSDAVKNTMGIVAESLPLTRIERVEAVFPKIVNGQWVSVEWLPTLRPSSPNPFSVGKLYPNECKWMRCQKTVWDWQQELTAHTPSHAVEEAQTR